MALFDPKAKNIANYQKSIDEKKVSISRYYDEIGRYYYNQYKDLNVDNTKDINTRCEAITRLTMRPSPWRMPQLPSGLCIFFSLICLLKMMLLN